MKIDWVYVIFSGGQWKKLNSCRMINAPSGSFEYHHINLPTFANKNKNLPGKTHERLAVSRNIRIFTKKSKFPRSND